ncbi:DUF3857 domain-containing protein [candidate division KSB1 bacterium]|nr:DUF3857 domain-containing protein [candidate division KSB1 bacterium]
MKVNISRFVLMAWFLYGVPGLIAGLEWPPIPETEWQLPENPEIALKDAVILFEAGTLREMETDYYYEYYARVKVFNEKGKDIGTWEISYDDEATRIVDIQGRVHKPDRSMVTLTEKDIFIEKLFKKGEQKELIKKVIFPGIETGCIIEFFYAKKAKYPILRWNFQNPYYTIESCYSYEPKDLLFDWRLLNSYGNYPEVEFIPNREKMKKIVFTLRNIAPLMPEENMPPVADYKTALLISLVRSSFSWFYSSSIRFLSYSYKIIPSHVGLATYYYNTAEFWSTKAQEYGKFFSYLYDDSTCLEKVVKKVVLATDNPATRMKKLYDYIQENYFVHEYLPKEKRKKENTIPFDFKQMIEQKYGETDNLNLLYAGLLRKAGIKASVIAVRDSDESLFNNEVLRENFDRFLTIVDTAKHEFCFLSPGTPRLPFKSLPWYCQSTTGLIFNYQQKGDFFHIKSLVETSPDESPASNTEFSEATIKIEPDYSALVQARINLKGQADFAFKSKFMSNSNEELQREFKKAFEARWPEMECTNFNISNRDSTYEFTQISYTLRLPNFVTAMGKRLLLKPMIFDKPITKITQTEERRFPYIFKYMFKNYLKIKIIAPENMTLEDMPRPDKIKNRVGSLLSEYTVNANQIEYNMMLVIEKSTVDARFFKDVQTLAQAVEANYHQEIVFAPAITAQK